MTEKKTGWTPGEWNVVDIPKNEILDDGTIEIDPDQIHHVAVKAVSMRMHPEISGQPLRTTTYIASFGTSDEDRANANLIAAAPELYEALVEAIDELECYEVDASGELYNNPRFNAILAKARGEQS